VGSGANARRIEARAVFTGDDANESRPRLQPLTSCDVLLKDLPDVLELIRGEVAAVGHTGSQEDSERLPPDGLEVGLPTPVWNFASSTWHMTCGGLDLAVKVPERVHETSQQPMLPDEFRQRKMRAREQIRQAFQDSLRLEAIRRGTPATPESPTTPEPRGVRRRLLAPAPAGGFDLPPAREAPHQISDDE
jgi:hypothetical protein